MLYAAGEIVLVVAGILLALQIDNWKDKHQQQNQILEYEQVLTADLVKDSRLINETLSDLQRDTAHCWDFIRRISSDDVSLDVCRRKLQQEHLRRIAVNNTHNPGCQRLDNEETRTWRYGLSRLHHLLPFSQMC